MSDALESRDQAAAPAAPPAVPRGFVLPATEAHVRAIVKDGLRAQDRAEMEALGRVPEDALLQSYETSCPNAFTIMASSSDNPAGHPVGLFGVAPFLARDLHGVPWMLASDGLYCVVDDFVAQMDAWVNHLNALYPVLFNWIDERNLISRRWLERTGFTFDGWSEPMGNTNFLRFWRAGDPTTH